MFYYFGHFAFTFWLLIVGLDRLLEGEAVGDFMCGRVVVLYLFFCCLGYYFVCFSFSLQFAGVWCAWIPGWGDIARDIGLRFEF